MTIREALLAGKALLERAGVEDAALDARLLLEHASGLTHSELLLAAAGDLTEAKQKAYDALIARRAAREPLQHITGSVSFMGLKIVCDGRALIPRQETELLVEQAIRYSLATRKQRTEAGQKDLPEAQSAERCSDPPKGGLTALDLCTGTGCIAIALAKFGFFSSVTASDVSEEALSLAAENIEENKASVTLAKGDLFEAVPDQRFDVIVSNPPYIAAEELKDLMPEVKDHDPLSALDGGADGLTFYRRIAAEAMGHLNKGGRLFLEIGAGQAAAVRALLIGNGFADICVLQDYSGLDRIVTAAGGNDV